MPYYNTYYYTRKQRGLKQRMFLLEVDNLDTNKWSFLVKGTTNNYHLSINSEEINCSCPDFSQRGRICKHLYFIIGRIGQCEDIINTLETDIEKGQRGSVLTEAELNTVHNSLVSRLSQRIFAKINNKNDNNDETRKLEVDGDCSICYESLSEGDIMKCRDGNAPHCNGYFHTICINDWLKHNPSCPHCRRGWAKMAEPDHDPLDQMTTVKIPGMHIDMQQQTV